MTAEHEWTPAEARSHQALGNLSQVTDLLIDASVVRGNLNDLEVIISYSLTIVLDAFYEHPEALPAWVMAMRADPAGPLHIQPDEKLPEGTASPEEAKLEIITMLLEGLTDAVDGN